MTCPCREAHPVSPNNERKTMQCTSTRKLPISRSHAAHPFSTPHHSIKKTPSSSPTAPPHHLLNPILAVLAITFSRSCTLNSSNLRCTATPTRPRASRIPPQARHRNRLRRMHNAHPCPRILHPMHIITRNPLNPRTRRLHRSRSHHIQPLFQRDVAIRDGI